MVKITKDAIFNVLGERIVLKANEVKSSNELPPEILNNILAYGYAVKIQNRNNSPVRKNGGAK